MSLRTNLGWLREAIVHDLRPGDKDYPRGKNDLKTSEKIAGYLWQIVEMVRPSLFFPTGRPLAIDRVGMLFPNVTELHAAHTLNVFEREDDAGAINTKKDMLADDYNVAHSLEYVQWGYAIEEGIAPGKKYIDAFPQHPVRDSPVTIWQEVEEDASTTRPMGAGIFIVAGTLASELGLKPQPHFVALVQVLWKADVVMVFWNTDAGILESTWPIVGRFVFSGVVDAGLLEALMSFCEGRTSEDLTPFTLPSVSLTNKRHTASLGSWKTRREVLPCAYESAHWSPYVHSQWQRRIEYDIRRRVVDHARRTPRPFKKAGSPFQGMGIFLSAVQSTDIGMVPKPALSVAPLKLETATEQRRRRSFFSTPKFGRVQQSVFHKWDYRTKPRSIPTLLCDMHNDFQHVSPILDNISIGSDYLALSYTWGQWEEKDQNLRNEILEVAKELGVRYVWVDAWCIDKDMKNTEIPKMGEYYASASAVVVLLPDVESRTAYTNLTHGAPFDLRKARRDDAALGREVASSQWRSRVWTLQEGLLGQNCIVKTRHQILDGEYLDHLLHLPGHCRDAQWAGLGHTYSINSSIGNVRGYWKEDKLQVYNCTFGNRLWWSAGRLSAVYGPNKASLLEVLKLGSGRHCTQALDSVIGLLGLVDGPDPPPMKAENESWESIWMKLVQSGMIGIDVLRTVGACQEKGMCWAPAQVGPGKSLETIGMEGEMGAQDPKLTSDGLEVVGAPIEVSVGEEAEAVRNLFRNPRVVTIVTANGDQIRTLGQVSASTGDEFVGIAFQSQRGDKGVFVLLGEWKGNTGDIPIFHRHTSMNVVRTLKLVTILGSLQHVPIIIG